MGVPTPAMPRREDHEVHKDMWGHWGGGISRFTSWNKNSYFSQVTPSFFLSVIWISTTYTNPNRNKIFVFILLIRGIGIELLNCVITAYVRYWSYWYIIFVLQSLCLRHSVAHLCVFAQQQAERAVCLALSCVLFSADCARKMSVFR